MSFLEAELSSRDVERLASFAVGSERLLAIGREVYAWHPNGVARSRLSARLAGKDLGVKATARNWSTTNALLAMAEE